MAKPLPRDEELSLDVANSGYYTGNRVDYDNADAQWCWGDALADGIPRAFAILHRLNGAGLLTEGEQDFLAQFQRWTFDAPSEGRPGTCLAHVADYCTLRVDVKVEAS